ncbi:MAG: hypothetical protein M3Z21_13950 [Pseudomonadota bacterium]|nr:hypothetical protein [Pseudomonadota bacterium]
MPYAEICRPRRRRLDQSIALTIPPGGSASTGPITVLAYGAVVTVTSTDGVGRLKIRAAFSLDAPAGHVLGYYVDSAGAYHPGAYLNLAAADAFMLGPELLALRRIEIDAVDTTADVDVVVAVAAPPDWEG